MSKTPLPRKPPLPDVTSHIGGWYPKSFKRRMKILQAKTDKNTRELLREMMLKAFAEHGIREE